MSSLIRPIDMSGVVQRSQEVSQIKQQENNKAFVDGQNFGQHFSQEVKHQMNSVTDSEKGERKKEQYDAKKKGNGREYEDGQQKKRNKKQNTDKTTLKSQSNFDIRI
jgi:hypothetical protein